MASEDIIMLSVGELRRLKIIQTVMDSKMTQTEAGKIIGLTDRQIRRIVNQVKKYGDKGICHKSRGKPSNRRRSGELKDRALKLYEEKYAGFGPTLASEKLSELDQINISDETLRLWLQE